ncbi:hypothetical protein JD489_19720 [Aeromonas veronii]|uniref:hypothetical protein n=1 Tax=Aeromonas veronii TaxID=654 RepID=UPI00191D56A6|nr:hypothetical protein [Aeromonas veronii]MBL0479506.1 hypothetical protein [Aeromonas veronii]
MISEATFAKKYTSFWNETLPNSKNYVRLINGGLLQPIYEPFPPAERKNNTALVNVLFFNMFRHASNNRLNFDIFNNPSFFESLDFIQLQDASIKYLSKFSYGNDCDLPLSNIEKRQTLQLFQAIYSREGANKRGNSSRLTQSFHFFMFEPIFSPVNALNQPI